MRKRVTMNIGKNIDQQILNGKRKTVHLGKNECAMVGFGKKPEQGGFGQIISRRMKNGKTDNDGGAKNCGSHVRVSCAVYRFLPGSESENQRVQDVWPAPSDSGRNLRGTGKGKRYGRKSKKVLSPFFSSFDTDISMDLLSGRNARKTGSVSGKTIERTLNVICVF